MYRRLFPHDPILENLANEAMAGARCDACGELRVLNGIGFGRFREELLASGWREHPGGELSCRRCPGPSTDETVDPRAMLEVVTTPRR